MTALEEEIYNSMVKAGLKNIEHEYSSLKGIKGVYLPKNDFYLPATNSDSNLFKNMRFSQNSEHIVY